MNSSVADLCSQIKANYKLAYDAIDNKENYLLFNLHLRFAVEHLVRLVYLKAHDIEISYDYKDDFAKTLTKWIKDSRFNRLFSALVISDLEFSCKISNAGLHTGGPKPTPPPTREEKIECITRFKACTIKIQKVIGVKIFDEETTTKAGPTPPATNKASATNIKSTVIDSGTPTANRAKIYTSDHSEAALFWHKLSASANNTFVIKENRASANILIQTTKGFEAPKMGVRLVADFLIQKGFLRIAIYINDDSKHSFYEKLLPYKEQIDAEIDKHVEWKDKGAKSEKTRWIETHLHFVPYDHTDYARLAKEAIPVIEKYIEVFSKYLPDVFIH